MNTEELKSALSSRCPVFIEDPKLGKIKFAFVSGIITRYDQLLGRYVISAEVTDHTERSILLCDPQKLKFWNPIEGE